MSRRRGIVWAASGIALLLLLAALLVGADPPATLRYRRVFIPQSDLDQQIRGLLPLQRAEFERRIGEAASQGGRRSPADQVQIDQAVYRAKLVGDALAQGRAELTVASRRESSALLRLDPCNLALGPAVWRDSPPRPAQVGNGPDGRLACVVPRSGQLEFEWTLAGRRNDLGELTFDLQLPPAPINRLEFELPSGVELTTDQGLVSRLGPSTRAGAMTSWLVEAGGARQVTLHVAPPAARPRPEPLVLIQEATNYAVHQATIDVETSLQLDVLHQPLAQLVLRLDDPLQLTQVRLGEQLLPWAPLPSPGSERQVVVHFAQPLVGEGVVVQLSGVASWPGSARQRLPRFRVETGMWQEGRATLTAPAALQLEATPQSGGWQTAFSAASPIRPLEEWQFRFYLAESGIEIAAPAAAAPPLAELSGTSLRFQASQVQANLTAELSAIGRPAFEVEAQIPRAWIVDAIEVRPAEMLEDRTLQTRGSGPQILRLSLRRPIVPGRPLVVVLRAHRRRPTNDQPLARDYFTLARFAAIREARRLVELIADDPTAQIALTGDEALRRLDPRTLPAVELQLFDNPPGPLLFVLDQRADAVQARLLPTSPRYQAQTLVRAQFEPGQVRQSCRLGITPENSQVDAVTVRFTPPPPEAIDWTIVGESPRELTARRLQQPAEMLDQAVYELKLQRARRQPFEIRADFVRPVADGASIPLVSLPAAAAQTGLVELHASPDVALAIDARELSATAPLDRQAAMLATLRAAYRYEPGRTSKLRVSAGPSSRALPLAWVESLAATSRISSDGSADHDVQIVVHSAGQRELLLGLHSAAANLRAEIEGQLLPGRIARKPTGAYVVPLPDRLRQMTVRLSYSTPPAELDWRPWGSVATVLPQPTLPVLASQWEVQLAPGLDLCSGQSAQRLGAGDPPVWNALWPVGAAARNSRSDAQPASDAGTAAGDAAAGWSRYVIPLPTQAGGSVAVFRPAVVSAWAWCVALATAALVFYGAAGRTAWLLVLAGIAAGAAVLLPRELAPLAAGVVVGLAIGGGFALLRPPLAAPRRRDQSAAHRSTARLVAARPASILLAFAAAAAIGQAPPAGDAPANAVWRRVVIPVDDERQPVGDYVFLEPEFYDRLVRLTDRDPAGLPDWLLQAATYQPAIAAPVAGERPQVELITAGFELETFRADVAVDVGLKRGQIHLAEGRARLDGKAVVTEWSAEGGLRVAVPAAGRHRLELAFTPVAAPAVDGLLCDIATGLASNCRVTLPADLVGVEAVDAQGASAATDGAAERTLQLGPTGRLALRWLPAAPRAPEAASIEAEQLVLWNVRPGSVVAEGSFRIRPVGGQVGEVAIELDPRLRVLPPADSQSLARHWLEEGANTNTLHLVLKEPATTEKRLRLSFVWSGAKGLGSLDFPKISVRADKHSRDWAAVSLAAGLAWKTPPPARPQDPSPAAFAAAWGEPLPAGAAVLDRAGPMLPALAVEPDHGRIQAAQELTCSFSLRSAEVHLAAHLTNVPPHALQHRLLAADGLQISRLNVRSGERSVRAQWSQAADGAIVVQLTEPPPPELQIEAAASAALARSPSSLPIPVLRYLHAAEDRALLRVYRQSEAQLAVADDPSWVREEDPDQGRHREGLGRLAAVFRRAGAQGVAAPQVSVSANPRELTGAVLSRLVPDSTAWQLDIRCSLEVQSGLLDAVRLELPAPLAGPVEITPAAEHELSAATGQATQWLLVRPQRAESARLQLRIKAPLRSIADPGIAFPSVAVLDARRVRRLLALPRRDGDQRFQWDTSGLQAVDPATLGLPAEWIPTGYEVFEAVSTRPTATVQISDPSPPAARMLLADHRLRIQDAGSVIGHSTFDVVLGAARPVRLAVPPGRQLIHASVEGVPAQIAPRGGGQWELQAADSRLPQRIEVVYAGPLARPGSQRHELAAAQIVGVQPGKSLWTVTGDGVEPLPADRRQRDDSPALVRLETLAAAADELSLAPASKLPPMVFRGLWAAWEDRFHDARAQVPAGLAPPLAARVAAAEQRVAAARTRLTEAGIQLAPAQPPAAVAQTAGQEGQWSSVQTGAADRVQIALSGPATERGDQRHDARLLWAGGLVACGLLAGWGLKSRGVQSWSAHYAHFAVAALGVVWLAVGPAPWLGGVVLALTLWRAVRSPWPRATAHSHSSIVHRPNR